MPTTKRRQHGVKQDEDSKVTVDFGLGGLFKGLGDFMDLFSDMIETGESETSRTGEFKVKGLGDKGKGVYGFTVKTGIGGIPKVERFGNIRAGGEGPVVTEAREPLVDIFDEGKEIVLVAELPGVGEDEIHIDIQGDIVSLQTTGERKYEKEILLPKAVDAKAKARIFKNGILELRLKSV
jgi:HSP20 family protein